MNKFKIDKKINEIINSRCKPIPNSNLIRYTEGCSWMLKNPNEEYYKGFKRCYPEQYQNAFNKIFDELHPY